TLGSQSFYTAQEPVVGYSPSGELVVAYTMGNLTDSANALVLVRTGDRLTFGLPTAIASHASAEGVFACRPALAFDADGQPMVAWESVTGTTGSGAIRLARLTGKTFVATTLRQGFVSQPTVAVTSGGICIGWNEWSKSTPNQVGQLMTVSST